jgi:competence protein ComEC
LPIKNENHISSYTNQKVEVKGWICSQPEKLVDKNRYQVCPLRLQVNKRTISNPRGKILLSLDVSRDEYSYGQVIGFSDKLYKPKIYPDFNYQAYLFNQKIYATSYPNNLKIVSDSYHPDSFSKSLQVSIYSQIYSLKNYLIDISNQLFNAPFSSLFNGLLFGQTSGFGDSLKSAFVDSGLIHIVVVSGFNITILIMVFFKTTKRFSINLAFYLGSLVIVLFVIMVGASPPAVRAGIMGWIVLLGSTRGRKTDKLALITTSAVIMSLFSPSIVRYDLGFQLSFLATIGLFFFSPLTKKYIRKINLDCYLPKTLRIVLVETLSAQILTFPLILYNFDRISLIAPLANLLVLPLIPYLMFVGFGLILVGIISIKLASLIALVYELALRYIIKIAEITSSLPLASLEIKWFDTLALIASYLIIGYLIVKNERREKQEETI